MRHLAPLSLLVAVALVAGCASAGGRSRPAREVGGVFDDSEPEPYAANAPSGGGVGGRAITESYGGATTKQYEISSKRSSAIDKRGVRSRLDFAGESIEGDLTKADGAEGRNERGPPPPPKPGEPLNVAKDAQKPPVEASATKERLVIYRASMTVLVPSSEPSVDKLVARTKELGGYVENQTGSAGANQATVTLRVPAEKFYELVGELGSYGQVMQKDISATDVTKKVFDIELRLDTAEKSRQRLLDLLKSATKMEEILQIENQIRRLTDEIESMKGELRFYRDQVAYSTLAVTFYSTAPPPTTGPARTRSRFDWINEVGLENVMGRF